MRDPVACTLLVGAVLLDTVNLNPEAKAQKEREAPIAAALFAVASTVVGQEASIAGRTAFFQELLDVKADTALLMSFSTVDLLRQDYKEEEVETLTDLKDDLVKDKTIVKDAIRICARQRKTAANVS